MSTELLQNVTKPHRIHDDVESTFWVFYYISVHHFKIISGASNLDLFDEQRCVIEDDGEVRCTGGMAKMGTLLNQEVQKFRFESQPLTRVLHKFADILRDHYKFQLFASDFDASICAILESKGPKLIAEVKDIIKILDNEIDSSDWPEHDDAVKDQFTEQVVIDSLSETAQICETSSSQAPPSQLTSPPRISYTQIVGEWDKLSTGLPDQASVRRVPGIGERLIPQAHCRTHLVSPSRTSVKRLRDECDDEDEDEQIHNRREKRARIEPEVAPASDKGRSGIFGQLIRALVCKASKVFKRRKN